VSDSTATSESLGIALAAGIVLLEQQLWLAEKDTESSLRMHRVLMEERLNQRVKAEFKRN